MCKGFSLMSLGKVAIVLFIITSISCFNVFSASFDCSKATRDIEKTICEDERLSKLDQELSNAYKQAINITKEKSLLKKLQIKWLGNRNSCKSVNCIMRKYNERISLLNDLVQAQNNKHLSVDIKETIRTRDSYTRVQDEKVIINEKGFPYYYKITEFNPKDFSFKTIHESKKRIKYIAHNEQYLALSDRSYNSKAPVKIIDRQSGEKVGEKGVKRLFNWGKFEDGKLIAAQEKDIIIFSVPSLDILKVSNPLNKSYIKSVHEWNDLLLIQGVNTIEVIDKNLDKVRSIKLADKVTKNNSYCEPGNLITHESFVIISLNCGDLYVYNLTNGMLVKTFPSIAKFVSFSIHDQKLWVFPLDVNDNEKAVVYDFESEQILNTFTMISDLQIWIGNKLISYEKNYSKPSVFSLMELDD
jgi:uncharacterized protein